MGSCIICGTSVDGRICQLHEEDVVFEFRGSRPGQLSTDRFYRGSVDGFAEFGVFVDIGDHVTGLLHKSELDRRLDSLDWDPGDTVFVKVQNVRDNGNVDLGWSIRQGEAEFRGTLIDDPDADGPYLADDEGNGDGADADGGGATDEGSIEVTPSPTNPSRSDDAGSTADSDATESDGSGRTESNDGGSTESDGSGHTESDGSGHTESDGSGHTESDGSGHTESDGSGSTKSNDGGSPESGAGETAGSDSRGDTAGSSSAESTAGGSQSAGSPDASAAGAAQAAEAAGSTETAEEASADEGPAAEEVTVDSLEDNVGALVRLEGEIVSARQTGGPTVFEFRDETGTVDVAAFVEAGVRAYPEVEEGDVVRVEGEVERRRGDLQVETEALVVLEDDERETVTKRMADAMIQRARPDSVEPIADDPAAEAVAESIQDAATAIRRAVLEGRPVVVRHGASVDGYVAGAAIERATLPMVKSEHQSADAEYHYFDRRPLEGTVYDLDDATGDVTSMLSNEQRHGEKLPLFVFVAAGGTAESLDSYDLLSVYGTRTLVVEAAAVDDDVRETVGTTVTPPTEGEDGDEAVDADTTATALAANVAAHVDSEVRDDLAHLPAVSFWEETPEAYAETASEAGYDDADARELREAIALEAFYQSYEDKRELITDLLFDGSQTDEGEDLASHVSEQYRTRMDTAVETAEANLETDEIGDTTLLVLDTEAYTHRYEFPPTDLLLDVLWREHREDADALLGIGTDEAYVRTDADLDVREVVWHASDAAPAAGLDARGAREGRIEFLAGERDNVRDAVLAALAEDLSAAAAA